VDVEAAMPTGRHAPEISAHGRPAPTVQSADALSKRSGVVPTLEAVGGRIALLHAIVCQLSFTPSGETHSGSGMIRKLDSAWT